MEGGNEGRGVGEVGTGWRLRGKEEGKMAKNERTDSEDVVVGRGSKEGKGGREKVVSMNRVGWLF